MYHYLGKYICKNISANNNYLYETFLLDNYYLLFLETLYLIILIYSIAYIIRYSIYYIYNLCNSNNVNVLPVIYGKFIFFLFP